jgi:organic radical activating enzyme
MENKFHCNWIDKGISISHRGVSYCCVSKDRQNIMPKDFWQSQHRNRAIQKMNSNEKIHGCDGCYTREQKKVPSDRIFAKKFDSLVNEKYPKLMLIDFTNLCNLKCVMCNSERSSQWAKEISNKNHGIYKVSKDLIDNTVEISGCVEDMVVQGGEPTIMEEYLYFFQRLKDKNYIQNINLTVTTNGTNVNKNFYGLLNSFKSVKIAVSIDAYGFANDYIRWPSKFLEIEKNLKKISELKNTVKIEIHNALNVLSMFNFAEFLDWFIIIQKKFIENGKQINLVPMKVIHPIYYSPFIAPVTLKKHFAEQIQCFLKKNHFSLESHSIKSQMQILLHGVLIEKENKTAINELLNKIKLLDSQRKCKIEDFIPSFYNFFIKI